MLALAATLLIAACGTPDPALTRGEPFDPYEAENRKMHEFNRSVDRAIVRPAGVGYAKAIPDDVETLVSNFATNLSLPSAIVNSALQGNGRAMSTDLYRFIVNTTIGLGGLFDTATDLNMPRKSGADFGQTLYVWGVHEGPLVELPFLGAATTRDAVGKVVDLFTNPLSYAVESPERFYGTAASASSSLTNRGQFSDTIDSVLYESADSYAATRSIYLQNRRFKVSGGGSEGFADPYDSGASAVSDPYEDPYDQ
ncbi:MlaA family lipoprotein [Roseovarius carneus]|uniref:MlaA family lipoprotein n=1 Tax=Roseovarius carneus TaxID=2853164 RepID=UPI001CCDA157|nr:VacJ family lipoprotein [Roseovarius carneus]